jgi:hypothetical protein
VGVPQVVDDVVHLADGARQAVLVSTTRDAVVVVAFQRRRTIGILVLVAVLIAGVAAAGGGYLLLRTKGSPQATAAAYLRAWQQGNYVAMGRVSVSVPHGGLAGPLAKAAAQLGVRSTELRLGKVTVGNGQAQARFAVQDHLASNHTWTYQGLLHLVNRHKRWWVNWSPSAIYPA